MECNETSNGIEAVSMGNDACLRLPSLSGFHQCLGFSGQSLIVSVRYLTSLLL